ncbi:3-hydroxyacyl-CoA dehydrogenase family protein [Caniella muris]|uniref:3-hydroxyacyl-CoA dehydrogenase family protein n=1 Tax=Caniella muris TaxID=2941502 RepID=UPI00203C0137|nr:3-hydroxyacyl-CoA dehydrogenase NAD-binding domain-containing protein [Caniella muris]
MNEKKVAVIGSGLMGGGIAQLCAQSGFETVNVDIAPEPLERAQALVEKLLSGKVAKGKMDQAEKDAVMGRLTYSCDFADIVDAAVVVEAVPERMDVKKATFASIDEHADPEAVLLTNTSGLSVSAIAAATARPGSVMGMHFFYPAPVMRLVELIRGLATTDDTYDRAAAFAEAIGKEAIDVPELPGFVVNRLIVPYQNEGAFLVMEGVAPEDVDRGMKLGCNHPMGPCELMDFTGIDVVLATMRGLYEQFGDSKYRPAPILQTMVDAGRLGRKTGRGFYDYTK